MQVWKHRIALVSAKCSDCCVVVIGDSESDGYVPRGMGIGGGDYVEFRYCLDCGVIVGQFPIPKLDLEAE